jgi:uncharacterized protein YndB with AHSA1/START domain
VSAGLRSFAHRVEIAAPVERVWRAFTDSSVLERWTAPGATVHPREKGRMQVSFADGMELDAHIDVLVTPQRMRLLLLPVRGMPTGSSPAAATEAVIVEDFLFERLPRSTIIRLLSSGVPAAPAWVTYYLHKRRHWELALARLKVLLEKGLDERQAEPRY